MKKTLSSLMMFSLLSINFAYGECGDSNDTCAERKRSDRRRTQMLWQQCRKWMNGLSKHINTMRERDAVMIACDLIHHPLWPAFVEKLEALLEAYSCDETPSTSLDKEQAIHELIYGDEFACIAKEIGALIGAVVQGVWERLQYMQAIEAFIQEVGFALDEGNSACDAPESSMSEPEGGM